MAVAPNRGSSYSSMSGNSLVSLKFTSDRPRFPWQRKCENFDTKLAKITCMVHQTGIIKIAQFDGAIEFFLQTDPCSYGTDYRHGCF